MTDLEERIARHVYRAMRWAYHSASREAAPRWVDRGNSNAQTEARAAIAKAKGEG